MTFLSLFAVQVRCTPSFFSVFSSTEDSRTEQWLIIKSVVYERDTAKVYATDGSCREVPVGMEDTWLWRTEGQ